MGSECTAQRRRGEGALGAENSEESQRGDAFIQLYFRTLLILVL